MNYCRLYKKNKDNEQQSKNKKRMVIIKEKLINLLRIESKEIRKNFYNIELIIIYNTKLFIKTLYILLYTLFIFIFKY